MGNTYMSAPGLGNAASYMVSGRPFITSSIILSGSATDGAVIEFPAVTKNFTVVNLNGPDALVVYFAPLNSGNVAGGMHIFPIAASSSFTFNCKCRKVYLSTVDLTSPSPVPGNTTGEGFAFIYAELTGIREEYVLTGSGITD